MSVRDGRKAKFVWASVEALAHIRKEWDTERASCSPKSGLDVYHALTEVANDQKAREAIGADESARFKGSQSEIAKRAMVSEKTVARACSELERIGLLVVEADREEGKRPGRPSFYILVEPGQTSDTSSDVEGSERRTGVQTPSEAMSDVSPKGRTPVPTSPYREKKKEKEEKKKGDDDGAPVILSDRAATAWSSAKQLLASRLPTANFNRYIAPLEVAGERDGRLVLADSSEQGGGAWIEERARPLILEALDGFDEFEIVDEFELRQAEAAVPSTPTAARADALATAPTHIQTAFPAVFEALGRICEVKRLPFPTTERTVAAMLTYPDADHRAVVSDMEDWQCHGTGVDDKPKDLIATFRRQLERKQNQSSRSPARRRGEHPADQRIRELRERSGEAIDTTAVEEE